MNQALDRAAPLSAALKRKVVSGLQVGIFVAAIDSTLVSVALLSIARELGDAGLIAWVIAGYTVAAVVATPVYGSLSDLYGRQRMMTISIGIYLVACIGCMFAQSMTQLMLLRIVQGLGGGGILVLSQSAIADVVPPDERGKYQAWLSGTYALAALLGPVTGGYLTAWYGWRFIFAASLPLALIALLLTRRVLGEMPRPARGQAIDYASVVLIAGGLTSLLIALTRIGQGARLADPLGASMMLAGLALLVWFWRRQSTVAGPIMAPDVLNNRVVRWSCVSSALIYFAMIGGAVMLPLALQTLAAHGPDEVALKMLVHALAIPVGAFFSGRMMPRGMRFRRNMVIGALLSAGCAALIAYLPMTAGAAIVAAMIGLGLGVGIALPPSLVAAQAAVASHRIGAATAFMALARSFGGAIGLAALTSVLFASLGGASGSAATLLRQSGPIEPRLAEGFTLVFACVAAALVLSALAAMQLPARATQAPANSAQP